jgi:hypothetical protein
VVDLAAGGAGGVLRGGVVDRVNGARHFVLVLVFVLDFVFVLVLVRVLD